MVEGLWCRSVALFVNGLCVFRTGRRWNDYTLSIVYISFLNQACAVCKVSRWVSFHLTVDRKNIQILDKYVN